LKAPGFNPWTYEVKTWFQSLLFQMHNLFRYVVVGNQNSSSMCTLSFDTNAGHLKLLHTVGLCTSCIQFVKSAWFPIACESAWFQPL
jgi:predicted small integral membrane protein